MDQQLSAVVKNSQIQNMEYKGDREFVCIFYKRRFYIYYATLSTLISLFLNCLMFALFYY